MKMKGSSPRRPFLLGVNYWPASSAMGFWNHWDASGVAADFRRMRDVGLDTVRLFLTWEDFQTDPTVINNEKLNLLVRTLDLAHDARLGVMPTLFTGHMSGVNFLPTWTVRSARHDSRFRIVADSRVLPALPKNWFSDATILDAQVKLASKCAAAVCGHPALFAWDLGNENSNCVIPTNKNVARVWLSAITGEIRRVDNKTPITLGLHMEDLEQDRNLGPAEAAEFCDFLSMHGYPGYADFATGPTDERLLPFLSLLTSFLGGGKEVLFTEFGVPTEPVTEKGRVAGASSGPKLVSEGAAAAYTRRALHALQRCGATGAMMWCHTDYAPELFDSPPFDLAPHERSFGMFHADGSPKPAAAQALEFSHEHHIVSREPRISAYQFVDIAPEEYFRAPKRHLKRLFEKYCAVDDTLDTV